MPVDLVGRVEAGEAIGVGEGVAMKEPLRVIVLAGRSLGQEDGRDRVARQLHRGDAGGLELDHGLGRLLGELRHVERVVVLGRPAHAVVVLEVGVGDPDAVLVTGVRRDVDAELAVGALEERVARPLGRLVGQALADVLGD